MTRIYTSIGIFITLIYTLAIAVLIAPKIDTFQAMPLNEIGDFLAGLFGPLGLLWLILGYMQQGEELRLSTRALLLQAEELKNSVEQQRELVEVSRQQVESERESLIYERQLREEATKPIISIKDGGGMFRGDGECSYNVLVTNFGYAATNLTVDFHLSTGTSGIAADLPILDKGGQHRGVLHSPSPLKDADSRLTLRYSDGLGRPFEVIYAVARVNDTPTSGLTYTKL